MINNDDVGDDDDDDEDDDYDDDFKSKSTNLQKALFRQLAAGIPTRSGTLRVEWIKQNAADK